MKNEIIRKSLKKVIFKNLTSIENVLSVTFVGSFVDRDDLYGISDIDTVVVCDYLTKDVFNRCIEAVGSIDLSQNGLDNYLLKINSTFGPLKFDEPNLVVIHLMVYDVQSHQNHVILSPFTCLDWERSESFVGEKLGQIFPVGRLQPRDFFEARRGIENYMKDILEGSISYRKYNFKKNLVLEEKLSQPLNERHRGEYAFHIVRNLVLNAMKLIKKKNSLFSEIEIERVIRDLLGEGSENHIEKFKIISKLKHNRNTQYPEWVIDWITDFVKEFQNCFLNLWNNAKTVYFVRHAETSLNDGTFLGTFRDPEVEAAFLPKSLELNIETVYSSPLRRCLQTARAFCPDIGVNESELLTEINYGSAEGMTFHEFYEKYPGIVSAWKKGEDPHFPGGGENSSRVFARGQKFLKTLSINPHSKILVVSHNVFLRCLIGDAHEIPFQDWFRLKIPHSVLFEFKILEGNYYPNIPRTLLGETFSNLQWET